MVLGLKWLYINSGKGSKVLSKYFNFGFSIVWDVVKIGYNYLVSYKLLGGIFGFLS